MNSCTKVKIDPSSFAGKNSPFPWRVNLDLSCYKDQADAISDSYVCSFLLQESLFIEFQLIPDYFNLVTDERFFRGIEEFNAGRYFEAHEVLEDLWHEYRETDRSFIQGLIQLSAGFYHFQCANWKGATSQLTKGMKKLEPYMPQHLGLDLTKFLNESGDYLKLTRDAMEGKIDSPDLADFPRISVLVKNGSKP